MFRSINLSKAIRVSAKEKQVEEEKKVNYIYIFACILFQHDFDVSILVSVSNPFFLRLKCPNWMKSLAMFCSVSHILRACVNDGSGGQLMDKHQDSAAPHARHVFVSAVEPNLHIYCVSHLYCSRISSTSVGSTPRKNLKKKIESRFCKICIYLLYLHVWHQLACFAPTWMFLGNARCQHRNWPMYSDFTTKKDWREILCQRRVLVCCYLPKGVRTLLSLPLSSWFSKFIIVFINRKRNVELEVDTEETRDRW